MSKFAAGAVSEFIGAGALTLIGAAAIMHGQPLLGVAADGRLDRPVEGSGVGGHVTIPRGWDRRKGLHPVASSRLASDEDRDHGGPRAQREQGHPLRGRGGDPEERHEDPLGPYGVLVEEDPDHPSAPEGVDDAGDGPALGDDLDTRPPPHAVHDGLEDGMVEGPDDLGERQGSEVVAGR